MVEITYQMILSTIQTASLVVGIFYYITILRNQQKNQELTRKAQELALETRQAQLFMDQYRDTSKAETQMLAWELQSWEWADPADFMEKYWSDPSKQAKWVTFMLYMNGLGILLHENYIPAELQYMMDQDGVACLMFWFQWEPVIMELRKRRNNPNLAKYFEYYVGEMIRLRKLEGLPTKWSTTLQSLVDE
jgi:hypothetical protein